MFDTLKEINRRPDPYSVYTAESLWSDEYRSKQMLAYHLNKEMDVSSRNHEFVDRSAQWIIDRFQLNENSRVCDFGCGPGLYTSRFARSGAEVVGIDFSQNSLEYAKQQAASNNLGIEYIHGNYLEAEIQGSFDLITMIMCDFCALSPQQRQKLLDRFKQLIGNQGKVLLDVYSFASFEEKEEASVVEKNQLHHFWFEEDYYAFVNTFKYPDEKVVLDKYSLFSEKGQRETVYNWLQHYDRAALESELSNAGVNISEIYSNVAGDEFQTDSPEFAVIAESA